MDSKNGFIHFQRSQYNTLDNLESIQGSKINCKSKWMLMYSNLVVPITKMLRMRDFTKV